MMTKVSYRPTGERGMYVLHDPACPAYRWTVKVRDGNGRLVPNPAREPRCRCEPWYKGKHKHRWSQPTHEKSEVRAWLGMVQTNRKALDARAAEGWTLGEASERWLAGVKSGHIKRRRRGKAESYAATTIPDYEAIVAFLIGDDGLGLGGSLAKDIDVEEWWDVFDDLASGGNSMSKKPLSYSRRASIKSVASNIYAYASQRALQKRSGVTTNPLRDVDLGANDGLARERVLLPAEAEDMLAALTLLDRVPFAIAMNAGPRRGIVRRIDWTDVLVELDGRRVIGTRMLVRPLEQEADRGRGKLREPIDIPIAPMLRSVLLEEWESEGRPTHGPIVRRSLVAGRFYAAADKAWAAANRRRAERLGRPLRKRGTGEAWGDEHEIESIRLHECRHTYASWLMAYTNHSTRQMMRFMGINQMSTFQRYAKIIEEQTPRSEDEQPVDLFEFRQRQAT